VVDDWGTGTGGGGQEQHEPPLPGWMRRAPSGDFGSRGSTLRERARHRADRVRGRTPLNAPVYAHAPAPAEQRSFWSAGKGVLLTSAFAAGSLALVLIMVALVRTDPDNASADGEDGIAIAGDPTTTGPDGGFDSDKAPLEAPTSSTTSTPSTTEAPTTTVAVTEPPTTAPPTTPPTTAAPTTTTGPTTTRQAAPAITSFRADNAFGWCNDRDEIRVRFSWSTTNATEARLGRQGRSANRVDTSSSTEGCVDRRETWVLSVSGPGGTDNATVTTPG
jgi:hypothetical protein